MDRDLVEVSDVESRSDTGRSDIGERPREIGLETSGKTFKIIEIIEMLFVLGLNSFSIWEDILGKVGKSDSMQSDPLLLQLYLILQQLLATFSTYIHSNCDLSQHKLQFFFDDEKDLKELLSIFNPLLKKKSFKEKTFELDIVNKFNTIVRSLKNEKHESEPEKKSKKRKASKQSSKQSKKLKKRSSSFSSSSSSSSSCSSSSDSQSDFEKCFEIKNDKKSVPHIRQQFQFLADKNVKKRITSPGEQGTHLVKIEITDTKDLRKCESDQTYWTKVYKKGYFLLNVKEDDEDGDTLKQLDGILVKACKKVSKIENIKKEKWSDKKLRKSKK